MGPRRIGDRFVLGERLGRGGMGDVFRAFDEQSGRDVALKRIRISHAASDDVVRRFTAEARKTEWVQHPHVVGVEAAGVDDVGRPYFVMELLEGETLEQGIERRGPFSPDRAIHIVVQLLEALEAAHTPTGDRPGVVHRDLKPSNVMLVLGPDGEPDFVKVLDFGIAKSLETTTGNHTVEGTLVGTPYYMAPEVLLHAGLAPHPRIDVYGVGALFFELLTGQSPWKGRTVEEIAAAMRAGTAAPSIRAAAPYLPETLEDVVALALALVPEERFQTASELRDALLDLGSLDMASLRRGTLVDETYEIESRLGQGGYGVVYLVRDRRRDRTCALKLSLEPCGSDEVEVRERFYQEARLSVHHPNLVDVYCSGDWTGHPYLVMEYVEGRTLRFAWEEMNWQQFISVMKDVASGLETLHVGSPGTELEFAL